MRDKRNRKATESGFTVAEKVAMSLVLGLATYAFVSAAVVVLGAI